jgi:Flp pilus assembly protein TadD
MAFRPDHAHIYQLFGLYLQKLGRKDDAMQYYRKALDLAPTSAEINYNLGLLYLSLNKPDRAASCAKAAYELGYPLPGLKRKLERAGITLDTVADEPACAEGEAEPGSPEN